MGAERGRGAGGARIAITSGDCNGIGSEVALKAAAAAARGEAGRVASVVLVGPRNVWEDAMRVCGWTAEKPPEVEALATPGPEARPLPLPAICTWDPAMAEEPQIRPGCVAADAALSAYASIAGAVSAALNGHVDAIVTAPVSEAAFQLADIREAGEDEVLARLTKTPRGAMTEAIDDGAKRTEGLPIVRTAPSHGPEFELAGQGVADEGPMVAAVRWAVRAVARIDE